MLINDNRIYGISTGLINKVYEAVEVLVYLDLNFRPFRQKVQLRLEDVLLDTLNRPLDNRNLYLEDTAICL